MKDCFITVNVNIGGGIFRGQIGLEFRQSLQDLTFDQAAEIQKRFFALGQQIKEEFSKQ